MKGMGKWGLLAAVVMTVSACAPAPLIKGQASYVGPAFDQTQVRQGGVALLPVVAGMGVEGYRRPFGDAMNAAAAALLPTGSFLTWQETMQRLNEADLVEDYQQAIAAYASTSMVPRRLVQSMATATGANSFLYVALNPPVSKTNRRPSVWGGSMATDTHVGISASGQVWSAVGDVVWEGIGSSEVRASTDAFQLVPEAERSLDLHSQRAANALIRAVLGMPAQQ